MQNGQAKTKPNGQTRPAKAAAATGKQPTPEPPVLALPVDPLAFADELPAKVRALLEVARAVAKLDSDKKYAEGMRRASRLISIAVGQLDGASKQRIVDVCDQLEAEAEKAEKILRAP